MFQNFIVDKVIDKQNSGGLKGFNGLEGKQFRIEWACASVIIAEIVGG
jgi:hypothetical protein